MNTCNPSPTLCLHVQMPNGSWIQLGHLQVGDDITDEHCIVSYEQTKMLDSCGACDVIVIVIGNRHSDMSSKPKPHPMLTCPKAKWLLVSAGPPAGG